jgi:hypothetical protein
MMAESSASSLSGLRLLASGLWPQAWTAASGLHTGGLRPAQRCAVLHGMRVSRCIAVGTLPAGEGNSSCFTCLHTPFKVTVPITFLMACASVVRRLTMPGSVSSTVVSAAQQLQRQKGGLCRRQRQAATIVAYSVQRPQSLRRTANSFPSSYLENMACQQPRQLLNPRIKCCQVKQLDGHDLP